MEKLLVQSEKLAQEANRLPRLLKIDQLLSEFKKWEIIGSTQLGLVYKPDLDFRILVRGQVEKKAKQLQQHLKKIFPREKILLKKIIPNKLIGVEIKNWVNPETKTKWELDFGVCSKEFFEEEIKNFEKIKRMVKRATNEQKELILKIKQKSLGKEKYEWGYKIYQAVLKYGIKSPSEYFDLVDKRIL